MCMSYIIVWNWFIQFQFLNMYIWIVLDWWCSWIVISKVQLLTILALKTIYSGRNAGQSHPWRRHQVEKNSALLALCAGKSPGTGQFPSQRPVTRTFGVLFDLHLNKRLSKQSICGWFETSWSSLWRHSNGPLMSVGHNRHGILCLVG